MPDLRTAHLMRRVYGPHDATGAPASVTVRLPRPRAHIEAERPIPDALARQRQQINDRARRDSLA